MRFLIFVTFLVGVLYAAKSKKSKGGTKQLLQAIKDELSELKEGQEVLGEKIQSLDEGQGVLGEKIQSLDDGQGVLGEKIQSLEKKLEKAGTWRLGMNINPADGHIFGYTVGWATGIDIGSDDEALTKDYLSANVWVTPANYIAIVRHQRGVVDAVKVFKFKVLGESFSTRFGLKNMNPGRQIVTQGGPIQESIADDADNLGDDPIFSVGGDLAFNWAYSNNGCRIVLTGGHLSGAGVNDDNTHGLGNDFAINPLTNTILSKDWPHDISNIQDCPVQTCKDVRLQGTDHGAGPHLKSGPVYGNYAIYVSFDSEKFPLPGDKLSLKIEM
ncbi:uncharacterized protein LOC134825291 [Bolinopsis microptera]|uniref:uncharacterized protein LOC134825291 n=1 Tax=Bolinopsis microptera TaxID=2820187 RepID=UPI003079E26D